MKIAVCSDIHLEFGDLDLHNEEGADVLILGGDILVAADCKNFGYVDEQIMAATPSMLARGERYYNFIIVTRKKILFFLLLLFCNFFFL